MGYNADSRGHPSARDRVRSSMRTQITTLQKPGLFGFKNSNPEGESSADTLFEDAGGTAHRFFNSEERDYNLLGDFLEPPSRSTSGLSALDDVLAPMEAAGRSVSGMSMVDSDFLGELAKVGNWLGLADSSPRSGFSERDSNKDSHILDNLCDIFNSKDVDAATLSPPSPVGVGNMRPLSPLSFCSRQMSTSSVGSVGSMYFLDECDDNHSWDIDTDEIFPALTETPPSSSSMRSQTTLFSPAQKVNEMALPLPSKDWSVHRRHCGFDTCGFDTNTKTSTCRPVIPRPSREILIKGMEPTDMKKQKIARYLEKRKRRLLKQKMEKRYKLEKREKKPTYQARSDVAGKRTRIGGRFVSSSEWGKRVKIPR